MKDDMVIFKNEYVVEDEARWAVEDMLDIISDIEKCGYPVPGDKEAIAILWTHALKDYISAYHDNEQIRVAVLKWLAEDYSTGRVFPKVAWIKAKCDEIALEA